MRFYTLVASCLLSALLLAQPAIAQTVIIENGDAPPNPENVIDAADDYSTESVLVRTSPTSVTMVDGGAIGIDLSVTAAGTVTIEGGSVGNDLLIDDNGSVDMSGGVVDGNVEVFGLGNFDMSDGNVMGNLEVSQFESDVSITGGSIQGDVVNNGDESSLFIGDAFIGGNYSSDISAVSGATNSTIMGDVSVRLDSRLNGIGLSIGGNVLFAAEDRGRSSLSGDSTVGGNLTSGSDGNSMTGGTVAGNVILLGSEFGAAELDLTSVAVSGGASAVGVEGHGVPSHLSVDGGSIGLGVSATDETLITLTDVQIGENVLASALAVISVKNATVDGALNATETSTIEVFGSAFSIDGMPVGFGPIGLTSGLITGSYFNGDALSYDFLRDLSATITLVPEPSTGLLVALGISGLAAQRRRRRSAKIHL